MKEKYESLSLATLKDLAKARGLKGISTMRKPELIERMLEEDRKEQTAENEQTISGTAEENTIPARPEPVAAEKTENTGSVSSPERREAPTRSRTIIRRNPEYRSNNYGRNENAGRQNSYNGENRPENFVKRTPAAKPVEVVPPAELRPEETEQPRTGAASENRTEEDVSNAYSVPAETVQLDSGEKANGILEVMPDGFGFIRSENYLPGENDIYVSPSQIRRFNLKTGDIIQGNIRIKTQGEKFSALLYVTSINGFHPSEGQKRYNFENMTPIFPDERLIMERPGGTTAMRIVDLISPIGKGQRGMIVSPPKAGKTTLLNILAALDKPTSGEVLLNGENITGIKEKEISAFRRENLGFVFQDFNLLDTFSLKDNIFLPLVLSGKKYEEMNKRLEPIAGKLGILEILEKYPYEVSGGQKQRAAVARALITEPKLVLADEPTGALDSRATEGLLRVFGEINDDGQTILMVTHSVKAASHAKRVLFIKDGEVFHQIYRASMTEDEMYQKISDTLTLLATGGDRNE